MFDFNMVLNLNAWHTRNKFIRIIINLWLNASVNKYKNLSTPPLFSEVTIWLSAESAPLAINQFRQQQDFHKEQEAPKFDK